MCPAKWRGAAQHLDRILRCTLSKRPADRPAASEVGLRLAAIAQPSELPAPKHCGCGQRKYYTFCRSQRIDARPSINRIHLTGFKGHREQVVSTAVENFARQRVASAQVERTIVCGRGLRCAVSRTRSSHLPSDSLSSQSTTEIGSDPRACRASWMEGDQHAFATVCGTGHARLQRCALV